MSTDDHYPTDVTDEQWEWLQSLLHSVAVGGGADVRLVAQ